MMDMENLRIRLSEAENRLYHYQSDNTDKLKIRELESILA